MEIEIKNNIYTIFSLNLFYYSDKHWTFQTQTLISKNFHRITWNPGYIRFISRWLCTVCLNKVNTGSIHRQGPRHTENVIKMVPVYSLFSTEH